MRRRCRKPDRSEIGIDQPATFAAVLFVGAGTFQTTLATLEPVAVVTLAVS